MSNITHMPQFDKLTEADNFPMWKLQMAAYLQVHKLMGIVEGTVERPVEVKPQEVWDTNDALAKLAILTAIDVGQHEYVSSAKTSATLWSNLLAVYERVDSTRKINVLREYHRYSYDGSSIAKHIACVENLAQQCDTVGETQSETNVWAKMLDGLPDRFSAVVTTWGIVPERDQTRSTLKRIVTHVVRMYCARRLNAPRVTSHFSHSRTYAREKRKTRRIKEEHKPLFN